MLNIDAYTLTALIPAEVFTSTETGTGVDVSAFQGKGKLILVSSAATAGTNPTLTVTVEDSANNSDFTAITAPLSAAFTVVDDSPAVSQAIDINWDAVRKYVRIVGTIAGTNTPTFAFGVVALGRNVTV